MRVIDLKSIGVKDIDIRDKSVQLSMVYDVRDGNEKSSDILDWKSRLEYPDLEAHKIVQEVKKKVKRSGEIVPAEIATPDYDKKLMDFLSRAKEKTGTVFNMTTADGYLKLVDDIKNMKKDF